MKTPTWGRILRRQANIRRIKSAERKFSAAIPYALSYLRFDGEHADVYTSARLKRIDVRIDPQIHPPQKKRLVLWTPEDKTFREAKPKPLEGHIRRYPNPKALLGSPHPAHPAYPPRP